MNTAKTNPTKNMRIGLALGLELGVVYGLAILNGNAGLGAAIGMTLGIAVGSAFDALHGRPGMRAFWGLIIGATGGLLAALGLGLVHGTHYAIYGPGPVNLLLGLPFKYDYVILLPLGAAICGYLGALIDTRKAAESSK